MNNKALATIGLCKKAGKLIVGFDTVINDIEKASGIIITSDLSEKTKKEIIFHCDKKGKKLFEIDNTMEEVESVLGKKTGIIAILDDGFFKSITKIN